MNVIIIGPQGSGKGTQAKMAAEALGVAHISTGDMLRDIARQDTGLGAQIDMLLRSGSLVSDDTVTEILKERISKGDCKKGFILDGYPRNMQQAMLLESIARIDAVIFLDIPTEESVKRLAARLVCRRCGEIYGAAKQPFEEGKCDKCGGDIYQRSDESEFAVRRRLEIFHKETKPLVDYYRNKRLLHAVNGSQDMRQVFADIILVLENLT